MSRAFVLSGGGSLGALQVGMLEVLIGRGVRPDVVIGTSVGSLNGTYLAARPDSDGVAELRRLWLDIARHDVLPVHLSEVLRAVREGLPFNPLGGLLRGVGLRNWVFPLDPLTIFLAATGDRNYLVPNRNLARFLRRRLGFARLEETKVPVQIATTDVTTGRQRMYTKGDAVTALLATTAVPSVFPTVQIEGRALMDGGVANNTALNVALGLNVEEIYVLPTGFSCGLTQAPTSALGLALHALCLLIEQRLIAVIAQLDPAQTRVRVVPPLCPIEVVPVDFSQTEELIERAARTTEIWLKTGKPAPGSRALWEDPSGHHHGADALQPRMASHDLGRGRPEG